ncbi:DUF4259 domain-containing protein [Streptomyces sp. PSRA5]|uniref:DUF4259 domain-containing protein n=1 Tax=Streptomyces panacea TaxID=3035064 RepID=UPI00339D2AF3
MIRGVLERAADPADHLDASDGERAVAAAALVVAQCPDGEPTCSNYGPSKPLAELPADLRTLAVDALDQVVSELSDLAELWAEAANGSKWRQGIARLRDVLDPPIPPQEETLFDIDPVTHSHATQDQSQTPGCGRQSVVLRPANDREE